MDGPESDVRPEAVVARCRRVAVAVVFLLAALAWLGWATGIDLLTRVSPIWPQMWPWTALWLAALAAAVQAQSGHPSRRRVWMGRGLAAAVGALAVVTVVEYATGGYRGLDQLWFADAVRMSQSPWPGRPSPQSAVSALLLAAAVALIRADRGARVIWPACMAGAAAIPFVTFGAYLFNALALVGYTPATGQALMTALALILLVAATSLARPDRLPVAWLLARPDRKSLLRLAGILAGFPVVVALARPVFLRLGLGEHADWTFSILLGTVIVGAITFFFIQREQKLLIEKEQVSQERADAEMRYRILAENAVDIVLHIRDGEIAWISPSVEAVLGRPPQSWTGSDFDTHIHPGDRTPVIGALRRVAAGEPVLQRFRVRSADGGYHWVEGHGKPYVDAEGNADGLIAAVRVIDAQVEAEQRLERMARFDALTGLANRAEAFKCLESALAQPAAPGRQPGVLFCDIDHFKDINDTWGHGVGDVVLTVLAARIRNSVRRGDTVGRTGGDEVLVLLKDLNSIDEATRLAEKIRCRAAEPIDVAGTTIRATLSVGVTLARPGESVASVTARADAAMYRAKRGERNTVVQV